MTRNLVQNKENLTDHRQIHFLIGSGFANGVESGDGRLLSGEFSGQLIAVIKDSLIQDTIFIDGGRKAESINVTQKVDLGEASPFRFTIDKNTKIDSIIIMTKEWNHIVTNPITINDETKSFSAYLQNYKTFLKDGDVIDIIRGKIFDKDGKEVTDAALSYTPDTYGNTEPLTYQKDTLNHKAGEPVKINGNTVYGLTNGTNGEQKLNSSPESMQEAANNLAERLNRDEKTGEWKALYGKTDSGKYLVENQEKGEKYTLQKPIGTYTKGSSVIEMKNPGDGSSPSSKQYIRIQHSDSVGRDFKESGSITGRSGDSSSSVRPGPKPDIPRPSSGSPTPPLTGNAPAPGSSSPISGSSPATPNKPIPQTPMSGSSGTSRSSGISGKRSGDGGKSRTSQPYKNAGRGGTTSAPDNKGGEGSGKKTT